MEKMGTKLQAETRANLYEVALKGVANAGFETETIKGGALIHLPDGYFAKMTVTICDATKFDLDATREEYQAKLAADAERAAKAMAAAEEKARKAEEKAAKAAAKDAE